jgi:hypothetical protein
MYTYESPISTREDRIGFGIQTKSLNGNIIELYGRESGEFLNLQLVSFFFYRNF